LKTPKALLYNPPAVVGVSCFAALFNFLIKISAYLKSVDPSNQNNATVN